MNADHGPVAEQPAQNAERHAVVRIVERRDDDAGVADVKIRVAGRQPHAVETERCGHRQRDHFRPAAVFQPQIPDAFPVFRERPVIFVLGIFFAHEHQRPGVHKAADVVNVAMRVVANRAFGEPENVFHAEIMPQRMLNFLFSEAGVAHLNFGVKIALLGGQQRATAVHLDAAAFDDEVFSFWF